MALCFSSILFKDVSIYLFRIFLSVNWSIYWSICWSVCWSICLLVRQCKFQKLQNMILNGWKWLRNGPESMNQCTDKPVIEGVEGPLQHTTVIGFGHMGYHFNPWVNISGTVETIFLFQPLGWDINPWTSFLTPLEKSGKVKKILM